MSFRTPRLFHRIQGRILIVAVTASALIVNPGPVLSAPADVDAVGALAVESEPAGADVYVDGQFSGRTPVSLGTLKAGDHRLRLVKDGYLENGRVVKVASRQSSTTRVKLTPQPAANATVTQVSPVTPVAEGGGSKKKWVLIGLAAGGGTAAALALRGDKPPQAGAVTVTPNEAGLAAVTTFSFSTQGASGGTLTYKWEFGDGVTATGPTATHTYASAGTRTVTVTVNNGKATAAATSSVTVKDLSGVWNGIVSTAAITATLAQVGASISGTFTSVANAGLICPPTGATSGTVTGTVSAPKAVSMNITVTGCAPIVATGIASASADLLSGTQSTLSTPNTWSFTRR